MRTVEIHEYDSIARAFPHGCRPSRDIGLPGRATMYPHPRPSGNGLITSPRLSSDGDEITHTGRVMT